MRRSQGKGEEPAQAPTGLGPHPVVHPDARFSRSTSPASWSTLRWWLIVGCDRSKCGSRSHTQASRPARPSRATAAAAAPGRRSLEQRRDALGVVLADGVGRDRRAAGDGSHPNHRVEQGGLRHVSIIDRRRYVDTTRPPLDHRGATGRPPPPRPRSGAGRAGRGPPPYRIRLRSWASVRVGRVRGVRGCGVTGELQGVRVSFLSGPPWTGLRQAAVLAPRPISVPSPATSAKRACGVPRPG